MILRVSIFVATRGVVASYIDFIIQPFALFGYIRIFGVAATGNLIVACISSILFQLGTTCGNWG